ncbi:MAG: proline iminopeptidase-family hydrolase [Bacteroidales bacterium]|nr:proline iminopeptidase-family hydrolase [Bacteroidales bacterium]MCF8391891.1 proline iminopeptidase-family hydrolase [Bacteroidales bacterium]
MKGLRFNSFTIILLSIVLLTGVQSNPGLKSGEAYAELRDGKIWYKIMGEGDKTPLLLLHGGPGGTSRSMYNFEALSDDRPIIIFDQLGSGRSDHHKDTSLMTLHSFVEQLEEFKNIIGLKDFYLYGHSWGTMLELAYYLEYPDGIKGLIMNSPLISTPMWISDAGKLIATLHDTIQSAIYFGEESGNFNNQKYREAEAVFYSHFMLRHSRIYSKYDTVPSYGNDTIYEYMWGPSEFTSTGTLKEVDLSPGLKEIKVPTLFITGEYDEARPETVKYFQTQVPNAEFVEIKGSGHATMHDNLRDNVKAIRDFLDAIENK